MKSWVELSGLQLTCFRLALRRLGFLHNAIALTIGLTVALAFGARGGEPPPSYGQNTAAGWALFQIRNGKTADFNKHCGQLDPRRGEDSGWTDTNKCRTILAADLSPILAHSDDFGVPDAGVNIEGAKIVDELGLAFAKLKRSVAITGSRFEGIIKLTDAHADNLIDLAGSTLVGAEASQFRSESGLNLTGVVCHGGLTLQGAQFKGDLDMMDAHVDGVLNANALQVAGALHMRSDAGEATFHNVSLIGAKVAGDVDIVGAQVQANLNAHGLEVGGSLVLRSDTEKARQAMYWPDSSGTAVELTSAKVAGNVDMDGVLVGGAFNASGLQVGQSLLMRSNEKHGGRFRDVFLGGAKIDSNLDMTGAKLEGRLDAPLLHVGGSLIMKNVVSVDDVLLNFARVDSNLDITDAHVTGKLDAASLQVGESLQMDRVSFGEVDLGSAKIDSSVDLKEARVDRKLDAPSLRVGGNLNLETARVTEVILRGATVGGDLNLKAAAIPSQVNLARATVGGQLQVRAKDERPTIAELDLSNARAGSLLDEGEKSWPEKLHLDGFTFSRFATQDMVKRGPSKWDDWARHDQDKSSYPYEQLAAAHAAAGDPAAADDFHFDQRVQAAEATSYPSRALSDILRYGAGYGIGYYMFRALYWALLLSAVGAVILRFWVVPRLVDKHGIVWCFGASVSRLLPFITLKKEFSDFFDNPQGNGLSPWQEVFFTVFAVLGWVLGFIVLAAMGTFTRGS